jgi:hypothetical protein
MSTILHIGVLVNNRGAVSEELNKRIKTGNKAYYANSQLLKSTFLSRSTKLKLYSTLISLVVTYATESWALNTSEEMLFKYLKGKL